MFEDQQELSTDERLYIGAVALHTAAFVVGFILGGLIF